MKTLIILSLLIGFVLAWGAYKTAEQIAKPQVQRIEAFQ